jgi:hypothetical protein
MEHAENMPELRLGAGARLVIAIILLHVVRLIRRAAGKRLSKR